MTQNIAREACTFFLYCNYRMNVFLFLVEIVRETPHYTAVYDVLRNVGCYLGKQRRVLTNVLAIRSEHIYEANLC